MDYKLVWIGASEPGEEKNISYWRQYTSKEEALPEIQVGDPVDDAEYAEYFNIRPVKQQGKRKEILQVKDSIDAGDDIINVIANNEAAFVAGAKHLGYFALYQSEKRRRRGFVDVDVQVFYGSTGTGKTRKAYELLGYDETETWRWVPGAGVTFFDGYVGQDNVIFDEFRGQIPLGQILTLLDGYPTRVQIKGSSVHWSPLKIILTSPVHPREWYTSVGEDKVEQLLRRINKITEFKALARST